MRYIPIISNGPPNMDSLPGQPVSDKITLSDGATIDNTPEACRQYDEMRRKVFEKERQQAARRRQAIETGKRCPFQYDPNTGSARECRRDCALYLDDSCALTAFTAERDTIGQPCPFMRRCAPSCALYNGGCTITNIMGKMPGKRI